MGDVVQELEVLQVDVLEIELGGQHVQQLALLDEAELHQALAQREVHGLLLGEALLELLGRDVALVHQDLADALAVGELELLAEDGVEGVLVDEAELHQHRAQADAGGWCCSRA